MILSKYFLPLLKERPAEAQITSHSLMVRGALVRQHASGIYIWLPLGLKVLKNIEEIVRRNMDNAGSVEILMPCVQSADLWIESGRFDNYGKEMLRFKDRHDNDMLFGPTNEDMISDLFRKDVRSYKDLPKNLYHIQWKFRDEMRPRFGLLRCREFLMKDAYTFDIDKESAKASYYNMFKAYMRTFRDLGISVIPVKADNGPIGGDLSHEFHVPADIGESTIYYDERMESLSPEDFESFTSLYAAAEEKYDPKDCPVRESSLKKTKGIEVGHIFYIGDKYSKAMEVCVDDADGNKVFVEMSSYGIGISRLVAAIIEFSNDEKGIVWPVEVAPFKVSIINLGVRDDKCGELASGLYERLSKRSIDCLYDDSDERPGVKFARHDLIGSPYQIIIGPKNAASGLVELKYRKTGVMEEYSAAEAENKLAALLSK